MNCEICPIVTHPSSEEKARRVIESQYWVATLRQDQEYLGTAFVTARRHVESLPELTQDEEHNFIEVRNQLITAQQKAFGAKVVNVSCLMNLAFDARGVGNPHVHYHLKPRYAEPVEYAGETFIDEQFGRYITEKHPHAVDQRTLLLIKEALQRHIV